MTALALVPVVLVLVAEASWIAVFAALLEAFALHGPVTGVPELFLAAAAGLVAARSIAPRLGATWPWAAVGLVAAAGAIGWLASGEVLGLLAAGGASAVGPAVALNPGGWLVALAVVRGMAHARLPVDPQRVATLLGVGVPGLALAAIAGGMIAEPWHTQFLAAAQVDVLLFLASGILALALARMAQAGGGGRVDWWRNPAWLALAGGLVVATAAVSWWVSVTAGKGIAMALSALVAPLLLIGFVIGFDRRSIRVLLLSLAVAGVLATALQALGGGAATIVPVDVSPAAPTGQPDTGFGGTLGVVVLVLAGVVGAIVVLVLARLWLQRSVEPYPGDDEVRVIDHGGDREPPSRSRRATRFRRHVRPVDAVAAYRSLLEDLDGRPPVAREPGETPSEHARRLRAGGHGSLALDLLAADYGLVRFGGAALTPGETRRALGRAERLRQVLLRVPVEAPEIVGIGVGVTGRPGVEQDPRGVRGSRRGAGPGADLPDADQPGALGGILTRIRRGP